MPKKRYTPSTLKHKGSYIGYGVGPIKQAGTVLTDQQIREAARKLTRSLNEHQQDHFMSNVKMVGIHQPDRESNWEWCPIGRMRGHCPACTHIFVVAGPSSYQSTV